MTDYYTYQKKRKEFGKYPNFGDTEIKVVGYVPTNNPIFKENYLKRDPNFIVIDNIAEMSEHSVNTEKVSTFDRAMSHREGGWWPNTVDPTDFQETNKIRKKKLEKEPAFPPCVRDLCNVVEKSVSQNNQIDLFEEYFLDEESEHFVENLSTKTLMLFKDQSSTIKRSVSKISWHPEGPNRCVVSYAINRFQQMPEKMTNHAYIWDLSSPNTPEKVLNAPSPVTSIAYNHKGSDVIAGGCYNGLIAVWDVRMKNPAYAPTIAAPVEKSHYDPVTDLAWLSSKTGSEFVTTSTDGRVLWWDMRKPPLEQGPTDVLVLSEGISSDGKERIVGGTVLEYVPDAGPMKYLVGTEQGSSLIANKRPKKSVDITQRFGTDNGRHLGPVCALQRNPGLLPVTKFFLSVGDWSVKIWNEEMKVPIIRTRYHAAYLSDGCWSPTRPGVFFVARKDGWIDVWDYFYRQNEIAFSHKVSDTALTCIKINNSTSGGNISGKLAAIGDQDGTVTLLELCESLYQTQGKEKDAISEMFERETRKEKNLDMAKKSDKNKAQRENIAYKQFEARKAEIVSQCEKEFFSLVGGGGGEGEDDGQKKPEGKPEENSNKDALNQSREAEGGKANGEKTENSVEKQ